MNDPQRYAIELKFGSLPGTPGWRRVANEILADELKVLDRVRSNCAAEYREWSQKQTPEDFIDSLLAYRDKHRPWYLGGAAVAAVVGFVAAPFMASCAVGAGLGAAVHRYAPQYSGMAVKAFAIAAAVTAVFISAPVGLALCLAAAGFAAANKDVRGRIVNRLTHSRTASPS